MINVSVEELKNILAVIDNAQRLHDQWRDGMQRQMACRLPPEEECLAEDAHQYCMFGRWFYSEANRRLRRLAAFQRLEKLHRDMHDAARNLCVRLKARQAIGPSEYDPYIEQVAGFRSELQLIRRKVEETLEAIDPLTGAFRGEILLPNLRQAQATQKSGGPAYSLLLLRFDLDTLNRQHGYSVGDAVLRAGVMAVRDNLDGEERIYRYTGAEFVICLPGKDRQAAEQTRARLVDRMGEALARTGVEVSLSLPIHFGIVALDPGAYLDELIRQAAMATYMIEI
jgi:diguanylate cyclase (GGDEF)-like protein